MSNTKLRTAQIERKNICQKFSNLEEQKKKMQKSIIAMVALIVISTLLIGSCKHEPFEVPEPLTITPNPFSVQTFIEVNTSDLGVLTIMDLQGREVLEFQVLSGRTDLSIRADDLDRGVYICLLKVNEESVALTKLIRE